MAFNFSMQSVHIDLSVYTAWSKLDNGKAKCTQFLHFVYMYLNHSLLTDDRHNITDVHSMCVYVVYTIIDYCLCFRTGTENTVTSPIGVANQIIMLYRKNQ